LNAAGQRLTILVGQASPRPQLKEALNSGRVTKAPAALHCNTPANPQEVLTEREFGALGHSAGRHHTHTIITVICSRNSVLTEFHI
jgi:hypothetical protein